MLFEGSVPVHGLMLDFTLTPEHAEALVDEIRYMIEHGPNHLTDFALKESREFAWSSR